MPAGGDSAARQTALQAVTHCVRFCAAAHNQPSLLASLTAALAAALQQNGSAAQDMQLATATSRVPGSQSSKLTVRFLCDDSSGCVAVQLGFAAEHTGFGREADMQDTGNNLVKCAMRCAVQLISCPVIKLNALVSLLRACVLCQVRDAFQV
jgi:hypothetical protein